MRFHFDSVAPGPPLAAFVEAIWHARGRIPYRAERILPNGKTILIFNLGAPFRTSAAAYPDGRINRDAWFVGPHATFMVNEPLAETHVVGVTFRPWGVTPFFNLHCGELADQTIDAELVVGAEAGFLRARLHDAPSARSRIAAIERFLVRRLRDVGTVLSPVQYAVARLSNADASSIAAITDDLGVSRKHLGAIFKRRVGLPPKVYSRIRRFNRALSLLGGGSPHCLPEVALQCGYFDQSHFNREFAALSGGSPTTYSVRHHHHLAPGKDPSGLFIPLG